MKFTKRVESSKPESRFGPISTPHHDGAEMGLASTAAATPTRNLFGPAKKIAQGSDYFFSPGQTRRHNTLPSPSAEQDVCPLTCSGASRSRCDAFMLLFQVSMWGDGAQKRNEYNGCKSNKTQKRCGIPIISKTRNNQTSRKTQITCTIHI